MIDFKEYEDAVRKYCQANGLSIDKARSMKAMFGSDFLELRNEYGKRVLLVTQDGHIYSTDITVASLGW